MDHNSYWLSRMSLERKSSLGSYIIQYNKVAQNLRIALLELCGDRDISRLELVREIFQAIDGNNSGVITSQEMLSFLRLPELHLFDEDPQNAEKFCELLLEQIDEDGNGSISLEEIATFIFPEDFENEPLEHEPGIIYDLSRRELVQRISSVAGHGSDEVILQEFATLAEATVRKGHLEDRIVKKALLNLFIPQFSRNLKENEADLIVRKLDADHHDRISAKSFKQWLFPASNYEEKMKQATYLYGVIKEKYGGSPREMFESFKSYGADCIYKADFITNMKGVDPSLSRQDAQDLCNALTGGEKSITFLNMLDFLGYCEEYERQEDDNTFYTQHSTSSAPFSPDPDATSQPLSSTYEEPGQRFSGTNSLSEKSATLTTRANSLEKKNSINIFAMQYNRIAQQLRTSLVLLAGDRDMTHYELVKEAFAQIDGNNSGVVTAQEMMSFLKLPQLRLFEEDPTQAEKFCQLLLEQIDENNDSTISLEELATFIFPEDFHQELLDYEPGIIYDLARRMLVQKLSNVASQGSDEVLLEEFAKLGKATAKKGHLEDRAVKKALTNLHIPQFARNLNEDEADLILRKLNADHHDRISAKSFKQWLFPASNYEEKMKQATYLYGVIKEKYGGSPREMFESFKRCHSSMFSYFKTAALLFFVNSYGADCIYKPDFITNIKGVDPSLSRQDAQDLCNALTGGEKSITFLNMLDFLGYCEEYERQEDDNTFYTQHSLQERSENTNDERNDANFQFQPNFDLASDERSNKRPPQVPSLPIQNNNNQQSSNPAGIGGRDIEESPPMLATPAGLLNRQNGGFLHVQSLATPSNDDDNMSAVTSNLSSPRNSVYASGMSTPRRRDGGVNRSSAASTASNLHRTPSFKSKSGGSVVSSGGKNVQFDRTVSTSDSYARKYNKIAQDLREALLRLSSDRGMNHIDIVKEVFHHIDDNDSGVLTSKEMLTFLQLPELQLFNDQDMSIHNAEKFCQLLLEQIDENGDGTISLEELATFIFPEDFHQDQLEYESGIIYDLTRKALVQKVSRVAAQGSDDLILQEFASLGKGTMRKGHLEDRAAKKSLTNLFIPQFNRNLLENEAELIMNKLDMDHHGRISAKSFKQWLFPVNVMEEKSKHATYMYEIVKEKFFGNPKELFESFQSYGADCIYKADFVTNIRAIDTSLSRHDAQDLANALCAGEKAITYGNLLDFLEHCKEYEEGGREQSYAGESLQHQSSEDEMDDLRRSIEEAQRRSRDPITTPKNQNQSMIDDIARRYALTTPSHEESHSPTVGGVKLVPDNASVVSGPLTPPPPIIGSNLNIAIPPSDNISVLTAGTATVATAATGGRKSSKPAATAPPPAPKPTITDEEREYVKNLLSSSSSSKLISTPLSPLQKSSILYKSLSQNNINEGNINPSASLLSSFNGVVGDQKFDFAKSQTLADIGFPVNQSMQSFKLSSKSLDANETTVKHGAVGYSAKELTEFGFSSHSGRWRGFPYDSFTCCNTSHFICPNSSKKSKSSLKKTTKKPTISPQESLTLYLEKKMKVNEKRSKSPRSFIPAGSTVNLYSPRHSATTLNSSMSMTGSTTIRSSASSSRSHRELGGSEGSRNISQRGNRLHQTSRF